MYNFLLLKKFAFPEFPNLLFIYGKFMFHTKTFGQRMYLLKYTIVFSIYSKHHKLQIQILPVETNFELRGRGCKGNLHLTVIQHFRCRKMNSKINFVVKLLEQSWFLMVFQNIHWQWKYRNIFLCYVFIAKGIFLWYCIVFDTKINFFLNVEIYLWCSIAQNFQSKLDKVNIRIFGIKSRTQ